MKNEIIKYLEEQQVKETKYCDTLTKSDEKALCKIKYVEPIGEMLEFMREKERVGNHNVILGDKPERLSEL